MYDHTQHDLEMPRNDFSKDTFHHCNVVNTTLFNFVVCSYQSVHFGFNLCCTLLFL